MKQFFVSVILLVLFDATALAIEGRPSGAPRPIYDAEPGFVELYDAAWTIARSRIHETVGLPVERYMDEGLWNTDIWIWDSAFMTFFCKYAPEEFPGVETLENFYVLLLQDDSNVIPMVRSDNEHSGVKLGELTQFCVHIPDNPPIMAWAEIVYARQTGDRARLERVLKTKAWLPRYYDFIESIKPGWKTFGVRVPACANPCSDGYRWEGGRSGMDNTPRGRTGTKSLAARPNNPNLLWVDLLCQQALAARSIAEGFEIIGDMDAVVKWRNRHAEKTALLNRLYWQEDDGFYYDILAGSHNPCKVVTSASFWALLAGAATSAQVERMSQRLLPGGELVTDAGVLSLSRWDADYSPSGKYWRGSVWLPMVYMTIKGLDMYGKFGLARDLALKTVRHQYETYRMVEPHTIWECYAPESPSPATGVDGKKRVAPAFCGWSALGPISLFIEDIIGIKSADAFSNVVVCDFGQNQKGRVGVENYRFGMVLCSIIATSDEIQVESNKPFELHAEGRRFSVKKGHNVFCRKATD